MIKLSYTLNEEEMIKYYQMILNSSNEAKTPKLIAFIWGPTLFAALVLLTKLLNCYNVIYAYIAIALSLIWVIFIYPLAYERVTKKVIQKKYSFDTNKSKNIDVIEDNGNFTVNNNNKILNNYLGYKDLIILNFKDESNLIVPQRVFESEDLLRQFIKDIMLKVKEESK